MIGGLIGATFIPLMLPNVLAIYLFPVILAISLVGCFLGTYLSPAADMEVLKPFYKKTNPWGFWAPVREQVLRENPDFQPNRSLGRDTFNVVVGIIWQMTLVVMPMYLLIQQSTQLAIAFFLFLLTTWLLKKYWWDELPD